MIREKDEPEVVGEALSDQDHNMRKGESNSNFEGSDNLRVLSVPLNQEVTCFPWRKARHNAVS